MQYYLATSLTLPVVAGLTVGVAFIVLFSLFATYALPRNSIFIEPPPMLLDTEEGDRQYEAGIGSYCGRNFCADSALALVVPDEIVEITQGSEIEFKVAGYSQPDELGIYILDSQFDQTDLQLLKTTSDSIYVLDIPRGEYILSVRTAWQEPSGHDAAYHYRINVTTHEQTSHGILSKENAIIIALNDIHDLESRNQADIDATLYYLEENRDAFEADVDTLERTPADDAPLLSLQGQMYYWYVTVRFGIMDVHWVTVNASNGDIEVHWVT